MPDTVAQAIVRRALELKRLHPAAPALQIVDLAMEGYHGSNPDFSVRGELDGEGDAQRQFGELLRQAFAPPSRLAGAIAAVLQEQWQFDVLQRFASRYALRLGGRRQSTNTPA